MGKIFKLGIVLFIITAVTGLILGVVYVITEEPISIAKEREKNEVMAQTLPGADKFESVPVDGEEGLVKEINVGTKGGQIIGWNYTVESKGYSGPIAIIVGISEEGRLRAIKILSHSETPGLGAKAADAPFLEQFRDKPLTSLSVVRSASASESEIQAISGATITSRAVTQGVNAAFSYFSAHQSPAAVWLNNDGVSSASPEN